MQPQTFSFRPQQQHLDILESRRFPGEEIGFCINRLFSQINREGQQLERRAIAHSPKLDRITFRPWPDVRILVERMNGASRQEKICSLIEMIPGLQKVEAIASPAEVLKILQGLGYGRLLTTKVVNILQERCAEKYAREYLLLLHKTGAIDLIQGHAGGAVLGGEQYMWVDLVGGN